MGGAGARQGRKTAGRGKEMKIGFDLRRHGRTLACVARRALRLRREEGGSELVEFAFVLPGLMIVLTGTVSFALALYCLQQLGNATANAVQTVAAEAALASDPCAQAVTSVTSALSGWDTTKLTYTMVITYPSGGTTVAASYGPTTGSGFTCVAGASELLGSQNYPIVLTVKYDYAWLPILKFTPSSPLISTQGAIAD